jgi:hypothetical protein
VARFAICTRQMSTCGMTDIHQLSVQLVRRVRPECSLGGMLEVLTLLLKRLRVLD